MGTYVRGSPAIFEDVNLFFDDVSSIDEEITKNRRKKEKIGKQVAKKGDDPLRC